MIVTSKTRPLFCVLLALSLCAPTSAIAASQADRNGAAEVRALAPPSPTILFTRAGARHDQASQRPSAPSLFAVLPLDAAGSDPGRLDAAVQRRLPRSLWTGGPRTGRSPPAIS
jgi:hypothetical protein